MDTPMMISLAVLILIAGLEVFCIFSGENETGKPPLTLAVPVFADSEALGKALGRVRETILRGRCAVDAVLLIDFGADRASAGLCADFCRDFPEAVLIKPEDIRKKLADTFAFSEQK